MIVDLLHPANLTTDGQPAMWLRVELPVEEVAVVGEHDIIGCEWLAIRPARARPQRDLVFPATVKDLHRLREIGNDLGALRVPTEKLVVTDREVRPVGIGRTQRSRAPGAAVDANTFGWLDHKRVLREPIFQRRQRAVLDHRRELGSFFTLLRIRLGHALRLRIGRQCITRRQQECHRRPGAPPHEVPPAGAYPGHEFAIFGHGYSSAIHLDSTPPADSPVRFARMSLNLATFKPTNQHDVWPEVAHMLRVEERLQRKRSRSDFRHLGQREECRVLVR